MSQKFKSDIEAQAGIRDSSGAIGTSGQVLSSTGSNVSWINQTTIASDVQNQVKAGVAINKGQAVYVTGADGTNIIVGLASNTSEATSSKTLGLLNATVAINDMADVVQIGRLAGLNTIGANAGDPVWLGTNGNLIYGLINKPYAPAHLVFLGIVTRVNANNGEIFVNVQNGFELKEIHDVDIITNVPINGDVLGYDGTLWVNKTIAEWLGYIPANASGTTNYVSKFTGANTLGNSQIFDNGTNVGIGTASPSEKFQIGNNFKVSNDGVTTWGVTNGNGILSWDSNLAIIGGLANTSVQFRANNAEVMRLTTSGNVGIGTSSPNYKLQVTPLATYGNAEDGNISINASASGGTYSNTTVGGIVFGDQNVTNSYGGRVAVVQNSPSASTLTHMRFYTNSGGGNTATLERMRILGDGSVGIGTTTPNFAASGRTVLALNGSSTSLMEFQAGGAFRSYFYQSGTSFEIYETSTLTIAVGGSERMRITSGGNVGINTTTPIHKLSVNGKIGGDVYADSFVEFTATTETIVSADGNVVLGYAQNVVVDNEGSVGVGTIAPESCAALEVKSLSQGFLPPRMRTGDRDGITNPVPGLMIFNEDTETIDVFTSLLGWRSLLF